MDCSINKPSNLRVSFRSKTDQGGGGGGGGQGAGGGGHGRCLSSRGPSPSPLPCHRLSVPPAGTRTRPVTRPTSAHSNNSGHRAGQDLCWDDTSADLIRSCGALSKALGFQRSFSCGDIWGLVDKESLVSSRSDTLLISSDVDYLWGGTRLDTNSRSVDCYQVVRMMMMCPRSLSTWVAVGDVEENVNSQLPSPHVETSRGFPGDCPHSQLSPADLIRSVNKNIRHNYIKRRLKVRKSFITYLQVESPSHSFYELITLKSVS